MRSLSALTERCLHIVSFDVPYPADYGGVIDVFYKVKGLHAIGVKVILHCYQYGRAQAPELEKYCEEVHYYPRNMSRRLLIHSLPFIVVSRKQDALLNMLKRDAHPILFEGKHTSYYIDHPDLRDRKKYVRTHNVEAEYYRGLAKSERNPAKQWYLRSESRKLERMRPRLEHADGLICISPMDTERFRQHNEQAVFIPPFHANDSLHFSPTKEPYCLYHGNLSVGENIDAAFFLIREVFAELPITLKIFGRGAPRRLQREVSKCNGVELLSGDQQMLESLVRKAQVQVLPTFQDTGMKLKLLYSLYNGGHVVANPMMVKGTGLEPMVHVASDTEAFADAVKVCMERAFGKDEFEKREQELMVQFSNKAQAEKLAQLIFD